jgi:two-component system phosphate regulon sensor histidine kinase PhoR
MNIKKNFRPKTWSLITAAIIVAVLSGIYISVSLIFDLEFFLLPLLISDIGVFIVSYFLYNFIIERFFYAKIKPIYKTIHTYKTPKGAKNLDIDLGKDVIANVNQDVLNWAQDRKDEIDELKKLEAYRREFLGNVSHELKTPLFNIQDIF